MSGYGRWPALAGTRSLEMLHKRVERLEKEAGVPAAELKQLFRRIEKADKEWRRCQERADKGEPEAGCQHCEEV